MKSRRKLLASLGTTVLLVGALTMTGAAPANAASCTALVWSYPSSINITVANPTPCVVVQARMYRLVSGSLTTLLGPISGVASYITSSNGSNAGNHVRWIATNTWTAWVNAPV